MKFDIVENAEDMGRLAAQKVAQTIKEHNGVATIGLLTGTTPIPMYAELARMHQEEGLNFEHVTLVNLDECAGSTQYRDFMHKHLYSKVNVKKENCLIPDGMAPDLEAEAKRYENRIMQAEPVNLWVVGIGTNGHIGFNEPGSDPKGLTRVVTLHESTKKVNGEKDGKSYDKAITAGLGTVMRAKEILLIADGPSKAAILKDTGRTAFTGCEGINENPSQILLTHPNAHAIIDKKAAEGMLFHTDEIIVAVSQKPWTARQKSSDAISRS